MCLDDPKEFDELQVYVASKGISFVSMDNDNPKVFGDTSILKVLFLRQLHIVLKTHFALICTFCLSYSFLYFLQIKDRIFLHFLSVSFWCF